MGTRLKGEPMRNIHQIIEEEYSSAFNKFTSGVKIENDYDRDAWEHIFIREWLEDHTADFQVTLNEIIFREIHNGGNQ